MTVDKFLKLFEKMSRYPYIDRTPCIVSAGKPIGDPCENAKDLLQNVSLQDKIEAIRKQFGFLDVKDYSSEWFKPSDLDTSGAFTEIRHCLRPPIKNHFQLLDEEIKNTIYDSYWNKVLGKSRDPTPGLPVGMNPAEVTFGKPTDKTCSAGELVNPTKKYGLLEEEDRFYHDLYAFSHQNYYPGEQIKKGYKAPFNENNVFGKLSNSDKNGGRVKQTLTWFNNDPLSHVSRRQANVKNRTQPALGKTLEKTGVTDMLPPDYVFGKPSSSDFYGVDDLLNECKPSLLRRDMLTFLAYANHLRQNVYKKVREGDINLEDIYEEIMRLRTDNDPECSVHFDCIDKVLKRYRINLDKSKLQPLLLLLGILSQDGKTKVPNFISFIDKNARFPELKNQFYILPPEFQECGLKCKSENPKVNSNIQSMPAAGKPSVTLGKPYPVYHDSIVNMNSLSEETSVRTLISPSIYTQYGVSHRDFFLPRSKDFLGNLFRKINVDISDEELDEIYKEGYELDKSGGVSVETFRNILDDRAYKAYTKFL